MINRSASRSVLRDEIKCGGSCPKNAIMIRTLCDDCRMKDDPYPFAKEYNVRLDIPGTMRTFGDFFRHDVFFHEVVIEGLATINTTLGCEASMCFNNFILGDTCPTLEGVDILGIACV